MRKIIIAIFITFLSFGSAYTFAINYDLTIKDKLIVKKISSKINKLLSKNNLSFRSILENKINEIQYEHKNNEKLYAIFHEIKINTNLISFKEEYNKHYSDLNIDYSKIRNNWLDWHNSVRSKLGRSMYVYDSRLDNTSYEWSKYQNGIGIMSHKRSSDGPFYDYEQIGEWFSDRGVICENKSGVTASESIGKFGYYCKSGDCSDKLLKSLKVIFDIYEAEKGLKYPADAHYRGIVHPELKYIGLGLSIRKTDEKDYYEYYVTTHYCTKFKN